jgi:hypothetical protein
MARRPLPSTGSLGMVPPLRWYYEALRLPVTRPAALRCLRLAVSRLHPCFAPVTAECLGHGPGVGNPVPPPGIIREGEGASQVPGEPPRTCPVLRPRRDRRRQAIAAPRRGLPLCGRRRLPRRCRFRGSIARPVHSLSTLRSPGRPRATQDSFPAAGPALPGGVGYPQGSDERFLRFSVLLSQAFLAHPLLDSTKSRPAASGWARKLPASLHAPRATRPVSDPLRPRRPGRAVRGPASNGPIWPESRPSGTMVSRHDITP